VVFGEPTLASVLARLGAAWRERSGVRVNVYVAPSDLAFAQIDRGARCDLVFALAGTAIRDAERQGIVHATGAPTLRNSLVLLGRPGSDTPLTGDRAQLDDVLGRNRVAIASPDRDIAGAAGRDWLRQSARRDADEDVIVAESAAGVVRMLTDDRAQLGIVYATDAADHPDFPVFARIAESHPAIRYVPLQAKDPQAETAPFLEFLASASARAIFDAAGLEVASDETVGGTQ